LRQEDIFRTVVDRVITNFTAGENQTKDFGKIHVKLIESILSLGLHDTDMLKKLIDSSEACYGETF
jgi:hypothetical protein